jgi:hypothetical protein
MKREPHEADRQPQPRRVLRAAHPVIHCLLLPCIALGLGAMLAGYYSYKYASAPPTALVFEMDGPTLELAPRTAATPWAALALGFGVGALFGLLQRRQLYAHRDFAAEQCLTGGAKGGLRDELRWITVLWPMLAALVLAIAVAAWLRWPAVLAMAGVMGAPALFYRDCRSIYVLAKRKAQATGARAAAPS